MKKLNLKLPIAVVLLASLVAGCGSQGASSNSSAGSSSGANSASGNAASGNSASGNSTTATTANSSSGNSTGGSSSVPMGTKTLDMATNADPNFNPWSPNGYLESEPITELVFNGLTKWGLNYQPEADLATDWSVSSDGLTWTFNLRKDVKWGDGQPFTSKDVVYTFENIVLDPKLGANGASNYKDVKKVVATNDYQVQFILDKPWASLPTYLAQYTKILPEHIFKGQDPWKLTSFDKQQPIGTGPYQVTKYVSGQYVELQPNPSYYGPQPKIPKIIFHIIPDVNTQLAQLLSGNLQYVTIPDPSLVTKLKSDPNIQINAVMSNIWYWVSLNQTEPQFQDVKVRQALDYAINKKAMIQGVMKGYGQVATGPIAPVQQHWYDGNVQTYSYDPQKAKDLLKQAGYTPGSDGILQKDGKPFVINMPTGQYGVLTPASELIQQYWQAIGIKVNLNVMDWNSFIKQVVVNRQYDASVAWWSTPTDPDQYAYFAGENAKSGYNIPGYSNPQLDKLFQDANAATNDAQRVQDYQQAQQLIAKQLPYLFLWWPKTIQATSKNLTIPDISLIPAEDHVTDWTLK